MDEIIIKRKDNGFSEIYVNQKRIGTVEDVGDVDSIYDVLRLVLSALTVHVKVIEIK